MALSAIFLWSLSSGRKAEINGATSNEKVLHSKGPLAEAERPPTNWEEALVMWLLSKKYIKTSYV